jgi:vanillate O-demethylase ferredoxin subunit
MSDASIAVRVTRKAVEATDICSFELVDAGGDVLPPFSAGAHIDVHIAPGLVRQYSLCNDPTERHRYVIGVLRDPRTRGGSKALHDTVGEGDLIRIGAPRNLFPLQPRTGRSLLLAGGIGVTPLLSMAAQLAGDGEDFELHYLTRSRERTAFRERIAGSPFAQQVHFHFDLESAARRARLQALLAAPDVRTQVYACGPAGFLEFVLQTARKAGWPEAQLHVERFSAAVGAADGAFDVVVASTGQRCHVPAGQTVIEALAGQGVHIPTSCEQGVCGTCLTRVLEGEIDHRDQFLTDAERAAGDCFLPCCSRAGGALLVLDL